MTGEAPRFPRERTLFAGQNYMKTDTGKIFAGALAAALCLGRAAPARAFWTDGGQGGGALEQLGLSTDVKDEAPLPVPEAVAGPAQQGGEGLLPLVIYHTGAVRPSPGLSAAGDDLERFSALAAMLASESRPHLWIDSGGWFHKASEGGTRRSEELFAMVNRLQPAAVVLGNDDLDRPDGDTGRLLREARFPVLAEGAFSVTEPYPGVKIGILGVPSGAAGTGDAVELLRSEGASIIVAAAHAGAEKYGGRGKSGGNQNPADAGKVPGADLLLGGTASAEGIEQIVIFIDPRTGRAAGTEVSVLPLNNYGGPRDLKPAAGGSAAATAGTGSAGAGAAGYGLGRKKRGETGPALIDGGETAAGAGTKRGAAGDRAVDGAPLQAVIESRLKQPGIKQCILGALAYLDDTQIRKRPGRNNSQCDLSDGSGCRSMIKFSLPGRKNPVFVPVPGLRLKNVEGEWASYIHMGKGSKTAPPGVQDSNLFVTAFVAYPLFLVDDQALPPGQRSVSRMRRLAMSDINRYKRGDGYSFWRLKKDERGEAAPEAPSNIPLKALGLLDFIKRRQPFKAVYNIVTRDFDKSVMGWIDTVMSPKKNPLGKEALFNNPNDTDDTAVAVANQALHASEYDPRSPDPYYRDPKNFPVDLAALEKFEQFRDMDRKKSDPHDAWKGENTGAFLTWLKDENLPAFGSPETGVIPGDVNLVDEVVNANAVFAMSLNGIRDTGGFHSACKLIADSAEKKQWQKSFIYYSQRMTFPYAASRAFRDGGADNEVMRGAMGKLLVDVLADQADFEKRNPRKKGAFPGGLDPSTDLSTALGVIFLLNVGRDVAAERGLAEKYDRALARGIDYLVKNRNPHSAAYADTLVPDAGSKEAQGSKWKEGLFFCGDPQNITQWVSEAFTTSMVLEAMNKYALAYDQSGRSVRDTGKLKLSGRPAGGRLDVQWSPD